MGANAIREKDGRLYQAEVDSVTGGERAIAELRNGGGRIEAAAIVVATNVPFHERIAIRTEQAAYRTYS